VADEGTAIDQDDDESHPWPRDRARGVPR
jgi:hypothetical protein